MDYATAKQQARLARSFPTGSIMRLACSEAARASLFTLAMGHKQFAVWVRWSR